MEDWKREKIMETATELFRKKGFMAASMQEIAEACGMAKASIYKFFGSKEELFTAVFIACHEELLTDASKMDREAFRQGLSAKKRLQNKIEFQIQFVVEYHLIVSEFKEHPIVKNDHFIEAWRRKKAMIYSWHREMLTEAYGVEIEPYIGDVVAIFRGIYIEYMTYVRQKTVAAPIEELAAFIVGRMDAIVGDLLHAAPKPVVDGLSMLLQLSNPAGSQAGPATALQAIDQLQDSLLKLPRTRTNEPIDELSKVVTLLRAECEKTAPDPTLIRVACAYLEAEPELRPYVRQLRYLLSPS
ncbi:TetR/AcrR family transcriptional regulator [Paenibacillus sp. NPDC058071]|uniref:TetR/AcrR family transcriptional regulator n=1 Tax=Paenibacillus sp. NPDC058071 TaxID=3346326 RepID=UPI0036D927FF